VQLSSRNVNQLFDKRFRQQRYTESRLIESAFFIGYIMEMNTKDKTKPCFSCGAECPDIDGPAHRYMKSSSGCWSVYGEILAREYNDQNYFSVHHLTVDTFALQHPGETDVQSINSVTIHLLSLYYLLEKRCTESEAQVLKQKAANNKDKFVYLKRPQSLGKITVADVIKATNHNEHQEFVKAWAQSTWEAWSEHHAKIRALSADLN